MKRVGQVIRMGSALCSEKGGTGDKDGWYGRVVCSEKGGTGDKDGKYKGGV